MKKVECTWCWISPDGRQYVVPFEGHSDVADTICSGLGLFKCDLNGEAILERLGWVKVTTGGAIWVNNDRPTQAQIDTLFDMLQLHTDTNRLWSFPRHYMNFITVEDTSIGLVEPSGY